jgi:hypothetical protein
MGLIAASLLSMWVVYDHPIDMPEHFVARMHEVLESGASVATSNVIVADSLAAVRRALPPGLARIPRYPADDPNIVEVWL